MYIHHFVDKLIFVTTIREDVNIIEMLIEDSHKATTTISYLEPPKVEIIPSFQSL